jgi:heme A synthase
MNIPLLLAAATSTIGEFHKTWGWYAASLMGVVGLWGVVLAVFKKIPSRRYWWAFGFAVVAVVIQVTLGIWAFSVDGVQPGNRHVFYGVVIMFTLAFAYIYRAQLAKRPALAYGLLALFLMGLGIRAIQNFGKSFG